MLDKRLCEKASGLGLSQASHHDADHGEVNPSFFTAGEHLIVFGEPPPRRKPSEIEHLPIDKTLCYISHYLIFLSFV